MSRPVWISGLVCLAAVVIIVSVSVLVKDTQKKDGKEAVKVNLGDIFIELLRRPDDSLGFPTGAAPYAFSFPADYGPHPESRLEWWYYTGNLDAGGGHHFGYQLTFFRMALAPKQVERESKWGTNQMYMAHFALTAVETKRFDAFERKSRGALGLAGAQAHPFSVWVENWSAVDGSQLPPLRPGIARAEGSSMYLSATDDDIAINLVLTPGKPVILHGEDGRVRKSAEADLVSYYYSLTRMPTTGTLRVAGKTFQVKGLSWLDREWGNGLLGKNQVGWSWFSLQLSDEREVMFYLLLERDGHDSPLSRGVLVSGDGSSRPLTLSEIQIDVYDQWQSPKDARSYPSRWRIHLPKEQLTLAIEPYVANQELNLSMGRYWEGAVKVSGTSNGQPIHGSGYVELTGFGGRN